MKEEIIEKAARKYADSLADGLYYGDSPITRARLYAFKKGAEFVLHNQWISVDERLPERINEEQDISTNVLFKEMSVVYYGWYDFYRNVFVSNGGTYFHLVTHWMEIPE